MEESAEARSTAEAKAGRPEPIGRASTAEPQPTALTPNGRADRPEDSDGKHEGPQNSLLEQILSRENIGCDDVLACATGTVETAADTLAKSACPRGQA